MISGRRALVRARARRSGDGHRAHARADAGAGPDRRRAERDPDAGVHPPPGGADRARASATSVLIGSTHSAGTLRVKEFLTRNGHPYTYIDLDRDDRRAGAARSLSRRRRRRPGADLPRRAGAAEPDERRRSPTAWASTTRSIATHLRDLVIVGAGPSGLAAAVYGASEGLDVLVARDQRAGRPGRRRARGSRTTSAFRPASPGRSSPVAPTRRRRSSAPR